MRRGEQSVQSVELLSRDCWEGDEPEIDGPRSNSSARRYTGEYSGSDVRQEIYEPQYPAQRRATAASSKTIEVSQRRQRRTTTTDQRRTRAAAAPTIKNIQHDQTWSSTRRSATQTHEPEQEPETGKIKQLRKKQNFFLGKHPLFYAGLTLIVISAVITIKMLTVSIQTWNYNTFTQPVPATIPYAIVKLPDGHTEEIHGFIDNQDHLNALIIRGGKAQIITGQNTDNVLPDPQHSLITVTISKDGKTALVIARGPYQAEGFSARAQEAEMNVSVGK